MMFCTTFLSAPCEELLSEGGVGGGRAAPAAAAGPDAAGGLGPGCLSSFHCLVLPQDELYPSLSDSSARTEERARSLAGKMLVDVGLSSCRAGEGGRVWGRAGGRCARSASPLPCLTPKCFRKSSSRGMGPRTVTTQFVYAFMTNILWKPKLFGSQTMCILHKTK